jgi:hypothetical protein
MDNVQKIKCTVIHLGQEQSGTVYSKNVQLNVRAKTAAEN